MASCFNHWMAGTVGKTLRQRFRSRSPISRRFSLLGSTVYIATDRGVLASQTGAHWRVITDEGVIDRFAVDGHYDLRCWR